MEHWNTTHFSKENHGFFAFLKWAMDGHGRPWTSWPGQGRMASAMTQLKMVLLRHAPRKKSWVNW